MAFNWSSRGQDRATATTGKGGNDVGGAGALRVVFTAGELFEVRWAGRAEHPHA